MSTAVRHTTTAEPLPLNKMPGKYPNGLINSFVASRKRYLFVKRGLDLLLAALVILTVMSWLIPVVALAILLDSRGPVFFRQKRIGRNGKVFHCIKFRTMRNNDEADDRPACDNDDRITKVGRVLRLLNIDELPQFFNVLYGHMSIIGPRPHMITDCIRFSFVISSYSFRSLVRPGITGWAQVKGYHGPVADYDSIVQRYYWDAMYVSNVNAKLDARILWKTVRLGTKNLLALVRR